MCGGVAYEWLNICGHGESGKHQRPQYPFRRRIGNSRHHDHNDDDYDFNNYINYLNDQYNTASGHDDVDNYRAHFNHIYDIDNYLNHFHHNKLDIYNKYELKHNINDSVDEGCYNNNYYYWCYCSEDGCIAEGFSVVV